jgi:hypothetical protein
MSNPFKVGDTVQLKWFGNRTGVVRKLVGTTGVKLDWDAEAQRAGYDNHTQYPCYYFLLVPSAVPGTVPGPQQGSTVSVASGSCVLPTNGNPFSVGDAVVVKNNASSFGVVREVIGSDQIKVTWDAACASLRVGGAVDIFPYHAHHFDHDLTRHPYHGGSTSTRPPSGSPTTGCVVASSPTHPKTFVEALEKGLIKNEGEKKPIDYSAITKSLST